MPYVRGTMLSTPSSTASNKRGTYTHEDSTAATTVWCHQPQKALVHSTADKLAFNAVPTDTVNSSDTLAALSKAMVEGVGKPEQVPGCSI